MSLARSVSIAVVLLAVVGAPPATAAAKKKRPDLTVTAVAPAASTAGAGTGVSIRTTVRNSGKATAKKSVLRAVLASNARRRGARNLTGSRAVGKLKARKRSAGVATFTIPGGTPQGVYFLFACADADRKVRESKETNNCRAARTKLTVVAPIAPPDLGGGVAGGGSTSTGGGGGDAGGGTGDAGGGTGGGDTGGGDTGGGGTTDPPVDPPVEDLDRDDDGTPNGEDCAPDNSAIHPGATDRPDGAGSDANCDGKDGDAGDAIYVSDATGNDYGMCGNSDDACKTIAYAIDQATAFGRDQLYVGPGTYSGGIDLDVPVSIYGGWDASWNRALNTRPTVNGTTDMVVGSRSEAVGILVEAPAEVSDINVAAPAATGTLNGAGRSSYGAIVRNVATASVTLRRMNVTAGNASAGLDGADRSNAISVPITTWHGGPGQNAGSSTEGNDPVCNSEFSDGGTSGARGSSVGGAGGRGGREDRNCGTVTENLNPEPGQSGFGGEGSFLAGGGGGGGAVCGPGSEGTPGSVVDGAPGAGASAGGVVDNATKLWSARSGNAGTLGQDGGAGGGGGGAGACEVNNGAFHGGGGGGGGAGGGRASASGGAGNGGGGSFALYVIDSAVTIDGLTLTRGMGGNGGAGGDGATGGVSGVGGPGGTDANFNNPLLRGGRGGNGGRGGYSGPGSGGNGGSSVGIYLATTGSSVTGGPTSIITGGAPGAPGAGGAGDSPVPNGQGGHQGTHTFQCAAPAAC